VAGGAQGGGVINRQFVRSVSEESAFRSPLSILSQKEFSSAGMLCVGELLTPTLLSAQVRCFGVQNLPKHTRARRTELIPSTELTMA